MIKVNSKIIFWTLIVVFGAGLLIFSSALRNGGAGKKEASMTPSVASLSPSASPAATGAVKTPTPTPSANDDGESFKGIPDQSLVPTSVPREQITGPATCRLEGGINFISDNTYESKGAKIIYKNVDDPARLIFWKITPDDGALEVGPNIFSGLTLPDGEKGVGVSLEKTASAKSYTLAASITYGEEDEGGVERIKEAECFGNITVFMP